MRDPKKPTKRRTGRNDANQDRGGDTEQVGIAMPDQSGKASRPNTPDEWRAWFRRYYPIALAVARRVLAGRGSRHDLEDIVVWAFCEAYCKRDMFEGKAKFSTWFMAFVRNHALNERKKLDRRAIVEPDPEIDSHGPPQGAAPEDALARLVREAATQEVRSAVLALPPKEQSTVVAHYYQDKSVQQIAQEQGAPVNTIKGRLHSARKRLAARILKKRMHGK